MLSNVLNWLGDNPDSTAADMLLKLDPAVHDGHPAPDRTRCDDPDTCRSQHVGPVTMTRLFVILIVAIAAIVHVASLFGVAVYEAQHMEEPK